VINLSPQVTGVVCIITAMFVFIGNDSSIKYLSSDYPIHELVFARTLVALMITMIITRFDGGFSGLKTRRPLLHLTRGFLIVIANLTYFLALAAMPLADTMALFFVAPLFITLLSAFFLKEHVGVRRWTGVIVGLIGMLVMIGPTGDSFRLVALLPLAAAACYASMQMLTRVMAATDRATAMAFYIQISFLLVSGTLGLLIGDGRYAGSNDPTLEFLLRAWHWPDLQSFGLMVLSGVCVGIGGYLISQAYRLSQASMVAPFEYSALPWGVAVGFFIWGDIPTLSTLIGIGLIVSGGLYVLRRESIGGRKRPRGYGSRTLR
jgi:S-adenosylmethionine uptake transporter